MTRLVALACFLVSTTSFAQVLWGGLTPGSHPVGFKVYHERDNARNGRPLLVSVWYPATASAKSNPVLFKDYLAARAGNGASPATEEEKQAVYKWFHDILERPFMAGVQIPSDAFNALLEQPTAAKWNLAEARGKFPVVLMSSEPESLSVSAEFLASNGFIVAAVDGPNPTTQPEDSQMWVDPTEDLLWLQSYALQFKNADKSRFASMGFGGGIQGAYFLSMRSDVVKAIVNLEGGVFSPRSLTNVSTMYHPGNIKAPMLHIVTAAQRNEDDPDQVEALVNTSLYRAFIQHERLRHHDFSTFGRVINSGLHLRGDLSDLADKAYGAAHKLILEFLSAAVDGKINTFQTDERFMPYLSLQKFRPFSSLVFHEPSMDNVDVELGRPFYSERDTTLVFDAYYPESFDKKTQLPVVVFVNGVGIPELHRWKIYRDWSRLVAASGMIGITYQTRSNRMLKDSEHLLDYLASHAAELGIDKDRIGLWSCSANVVTGLPLAMQESRTNVKALVAYYGMPPSANLPSLRQGLEIQIVRSGLDFYNLNTNIENFVKTALTQDLHFEYVNYPEGQHGFDSFDDTPRSREIIMQTTNFLKRTLSKDHPVPAKQVLTNSRLWNMIMVENKIDEALTEWKEAMAMYRKMPGHTPWYNHVIDDRNLNQVGYQLLQAGKTSEAIKVLMANQEQFPESANVYDALADAYEKAGDKTKTVSYARMALEKLAKQTDLPWPLRDAIKKSAEEKLKRLQ